MWGSVQSDGERRKEKYHATNLIRTRHLTYLNLIGQTNASIEFVPCTSQPQRNNTCVSHLDINYIQSRHNIRF